MQKGPSGTKINGPSGTKIKGPSGTKIFWVTLRHGDPKYKYKKVSRTEMELNFSRTKIPVELKIAVELKFGVDPWVMGTLRPSAKRSAELKHN